MTTEGQCRHTTRATSISSSYGDESGFIVETLPPCGRKHQQQQHLKSTTMIQIFQLEMFLLSLCTGVFCHLDQILVDLVQSWSHSLSSDPFVLQVGGGSHPAPTLKLQIIRGSINRHKRLMWPRSHKTKRAEVSETPLGNVSRNEQPAESGVTGSMLSHQHPLSLPRPHFLSFHFFTLLCFSLCPFLLLSNK